MLPGFVDNNTNKKEEKDDVYLEDIYMKGTETANNHYSNYGNRIYLSYIYPNPNYCDSECFSDCYRTCYMKQKLISYMPPPGWDCNSICTRRCCSWKVLGEFTK
jgi:hypothetical protein